MPRKDPVKRRLLPRDVSLITSIVSDLDASIRPTWAHVVGAALSATARAYTRQALCQHKEISDAYESKVGEHRTFKATGKRPKLAQEEEDASKRIIAELRSDNERLTAHIATLDRRFILHIANALRLGIATRELERPTEKPGKGVTDPDLLVSRRIKNGKANATP